MSVVVASDPLVNDVALIKGRLDICLPSDEQEISMCQRMVLAGARDGVTGANENMVDGMPLSTSLDILRKIRLACSLVS